MFNYLVELLLKKTSSLTPQKFTKDYFMNQPFGQTF